MYKSGQKVHLALWGGRERHGSVTSRPVTECVTKADPTHSKHSSVATNGFLLVLSMLVPWGMVMLYLLNVIYIFNTMSVENLHSHSLCLNATENKFSPHQSSHFLLLSRSNTSP